MHLIDAMESSMGRQKTFCGERVAKNDQIRADVRREETVSLVGDQEVLVAIPV